MTGSTFQTPRLMEKAVAIPAADDQLSDAVCPVLMDEVFSGDAASIVSPCPRWKRIMDVVGATLALVVLSPLLAAIAVMIRCASPGPVLFRQQRYGLDGRPFTLWKFRTVKTGESPTRHHTHVTQLMESNVPLRKLDEQLAIVPGGWLLRRLGLDELPQLVNVLRGDMSLVGPRPDVLPFESYQSWQRRRFAVLPGITGLWQVSGKNSTTFTTMIRLDLTYIRQRSLWFDLVILAKTIPAVLWS